MNWIDAITDLVLAGAAVMLVISLASFYALLVRISNQMVIANEFRKVAGDIAVLNSKTQVDMALKTAELASLKVNVECKTAEAQVRVADEIANLTQEVGRLGTLRTAEVAEACACG